jgi:hypothetical protein
VLSVLSVAWNYPCRPCCLCYPWLGTIHASVLSVLSVAWNYPCVRVVRVIRGLELSLGAGSQLAAFLTEPQMVRLEAGRRHLHKGDAPKRRRCA